MVALYEADSQQAVCEVEEQLVDYYKLKKPDSCIYRIVLPKVPNIKFTE